MACVGSDCTTAQKGYRHLLAGEELFPFLGIHSVAMVELLPFPAVHYNFESADLGRAIAPPYDQISPEMQDELYRRSSHSFVQLIFGKILDNDTEGSNRYTRAADSLTAWLKDRILVKEDEPAFFLYEQNFSLKDSTTFTRLGLVGIMRLEPLGAGVLPHEQTFAKPKEDRLNLMKATKANFEHVFFLYDDPQHFIRQMASSYRLKQPILTCRDDQGTTHSIWMVRESEALKNVAWFFKEKRLLIADGHHRYETSLTYQDEMKKIWCDSTSDDAPFNYRLGTFVSLQDPGLVILPTHRVLRPLTPEQGAALEKELPGYFTMADYPNLDSLHTELKSKKHAFGWITENRYRLLILKDSFDLRKEFHETPAVLRELDVFVLQQLIFDRILNLPHDKLDQIISFVRWPEDVMKLIQSGSHQMAFLLNPAKPADVKAVAEAGEKMPHKSTDFYPKLWSGLLFYKMEF